MKLDEFKQIYEGLGAEEVDDGIPCWYRVYPAKPKVKAICSCGATHGLYETCKPKEPVIMGPAPSREIGFHSEMGQMGRQFPPNIARLPGEIQVQDHEDGSQTIFRPISNGQYISTYLTPTQVHRNKLAMAECEKSKKKSLGVDARLGAVELT